MGPSNPYFPEYDYRLTSKLKSGEEVTTAELTRGSEGGFVEPRQYLVANLFLCLREKDDYASLETVKRASDALNNVIDIYRFVSMDPFVRSIRPQQDAYYTVVSYGSFPSDLGDVDAITALRQLDRIQFGRELGVTRCHHIGVSTFDDLFSRNPLPASNLQVFEELIRSPHELELFHQLILSAVRRLKRFEYALAVIDAQSAFESLVATITAEQLRAAGKTDPEIEQAMAVSGPLHTLQRRLVELDSIAAAPQSFLGSHEETEWRLKTYKLRNRVVHEGLRTVEFGRAKEAVAAALSALHALQALAPGFQRTMMWSGPFDLSHIQETAGRLTRLFEV